MGGKGGKQPTQTTQNVNQSTLPEYAKPYFMEMMQGAQGLATQPYTPYGGQRIADFTPAQQWAMNNQMNAQGPQEYNQASGLANAAGWGSMMAGQYDPTQFSNQNIGLPQLYNYQMQGAGNVQGAGYDPAQMQAEQSNFNTGALPQEQMQGPGSFTSEQAQKFMNPYTQNVLDIEKREAATDAKKAQLAEDLGASRQGTYGGSRQLLASMNRERNLQQQMGDVEAKGMQNAYEQARTQFNTEDAAQQAAGSTNLQARINQGQFGASQGMQQALANLDARTQAAVNNQAAKNTAMGMSTENAMRAALANQGVQQDTNKTNLQSLLDVQNQSMQGGLEALKSNQTADLERQRMGEQSRQFGAGQALAGYGQAGNMAQTLANIGQGRFQTDQQLRDKQLTTATMDQALQQQYLDQQYQDFLKQQGYPAEMLQQYSSLLRGVPVTPSTTTTAYQQQASLPQQILGTGIGALGAYKSLSG